MKIRERRGDNEFSATGLFALMAVREWRRSIDPRTEHEDDRKVGFTPNDTTNA